MTVNNPSNANLLHLKIYPNAKRSEVTGCTDGVFRVKVSAPPVQGKANRELINFLSQALGISKASLTIVKGHTSRSKIIAIDGLSQDDIIQRLSP